MNNSTCCFLGHRVIEVSDELKYKLFTVIEELIRGENIDTFLFGNKSQFDTLCYERVIKDNYAGSSPDTS